MPAALSEMAFISRSSPAISGIIACRAGIISAIPAPWKKTIAIRCS